MFAQRFETHAYPQKNMADNDNDNMKSIFANHWTVFVEQCYNQIIIIIIEINWTHKDSKSVLWNPYPNIKYFEVFFGRERSNMTWIKFIVSSHCHKYTQGHIRNQIVVAKIPMGHRRFEPLYFWSWDRHSTTSTTRQSWHECSLGYIYDNES